MSKKSKTKQNSSGVSGPWPYATPAVQGFVDKITGFGGIGATPDQNAAFAVLKGNAAKGNPWAQATATLADDAFNTADRSGTVGQAYTNMQGQLGDYATGKYLDPMSNPQMRAMLDQVGDEAFNRINAQFAGAGRDLSGMNQLAAARGVTQAQLPLLFDQYNRAQDQQMQAAQMLYGAGQQTAATQGQLDANRQALRSQGVGFGQAALDANNYAANSILDLDQQIKGLPYEDASLLASLLFPAAGMGQVQDSKGSGKTKMSMFSDERLKENVSEVGKLADGTPTYSWTYKGDPTGTTHMGVMAQDVEKRNPDAVSEDPASGYKMVDYDEAVKRAAQIVRTRRAEAARKRKGG